MRYSQDFIEKVRESNNIVEIIGQYTELKGSGHRRMGRCPFPDHNEKTPSFSVTDDNQLFYCYGCKKGGNVFSFLQTFNGMSFPESVEFLARRANIALPESDESGFKPRGPSRDDKETLFKINKLAAVYFHQELKSEPLDSPVRQYLEKRGLTDEIVEKFRLGLSRDAWQGLTEHFVSRKVPLEGAETLGLIKPKKGGRVGDSHFDLFRDRLMFPIFSPTSDVIGFGGRTLGDGMPKYVNSSDSPVFHKGKIFYGIHETGRYIRAQDEVIVVEGYMDAISLYVAGVKNVVAILGTAFTADHAKLLKRFTLNVKMLLDGDEAGISGAERSLPILLEAGLMAKGFVLPEKMDPDDYVRANGADQLRNDIASAPELFNLLLNRRWLQDYHGSPSEKVQIIDQAAMVLRGLQNQQLIDLYAVEMARQLDVDIPWLRRALHQSIQARRVVITANTAGGSASNTPAGSNPANTRPSFAGTRPNPGGAYAPTPTARVSQQAGSAPQSGARSNIQSDIQSEVRSGVRSGIRSEVRPSGPPDFTGEPFPGDDSAPQRAAQFAPLAAQSEPDEGVRSDSSTTPLISLKGAPRDEALALSLLLHSRELFTEDAENGPTELLKILSHLGVAQVLLLAVEKYRQKPESFASLAASLASCVDQPAIITCSIGAMRNFATGANAKAGQNKAGSDENRESEMYSNRSDDDSPESRQQERRLMSDYFTAIRKRSLKVQALALANQLRDQSSPEKLEQFMNIQRDRLSMKRD